MNTEPQYHMPKLPNPLAAPTGSLPPPENPHVQHRIYLDRFKFRGVQVTAPATVTPAEMERIKGWFETLFIIEEDPMK